MITKCQHCFTWNDTQNRECRKCYKRLKRDGGSGAPSGFAAAKRAANQTSGGEERSDELESSAVSPGEAQAALRKAIEYFDRKAAELHGCSGVAKALLDHDLMERCLKFEAELRGYSRDLTSLLPEPDSKIAKRASGRRNDQVDLTGDPGGLNSKKDVIAG